MADPRNIVLPFAALPTRNALRVALASVVRAIQSTHDLTDEALADRLGVSTGTIANVRNERTDLNQETIAKIGACFGPEALDPWSACFGGRNVPRVAGEGQVSLSAITGTVHKLSIATSDGATAINHRALADMLPDLKATQRLVNSLLARAEGLGMAAA